MNSKMPILLAAFLALLVGGVRSQTITPLKKPPGVSETEWRRFLKSPQGIQMQLENANPALKAAPPPAVNAATWKGALVIAQDQKGTFLGKIDNEFATDSIFNEFGRHGSKFAAESIFNEFGRFGGEFSAYSPFNTFATRPPMIIKANKVIGYLTNNIAIKGGVSVASLKGRY